MYTESVVDANVSSRQRWIIGLMCASIVFSIVIIGVDASNELYPSGSTSPGPAGFCIVHHTIILILSYKERKSQSPPNLRDALPAVASLGGVICIWLPFVLWTMSLGFSASAFRDDIASHNIPNRDTPKYPVVLAFIVVEYVVVAAITILMMMERLTLRRKLNPAVIVES